MDPDYFGKHLNLRGCACADSQPTEDLSIIAQLGKAEQDANILLASINRKLLDIGDTVQLNGRTLQIKLLSSFGIKGVGVSDNVVYADLGEVVPCITPVQFGDFPALSDDVKYWRTNSCNLDKLGEALEKYREYVSGLKKYLAVVECPFKVGDVVQVEGGKRGLISLISEDHSVACVVLPNQSGGTHVVKVSLDLLRVLTTSKHTKAFKIGDFVTSTAGTWESPGMIVSEPNSMNDGSVEYTVMRAAIGTYAVDAAILTLVEVDG